MTADGVGTRPARHMESALRRELQSYTGKKKGSILFWVFLVVRSEKASASAVHLPATKCSQVSSCHFQDVPRRYGQADQSLPHDTKADAARGREQGSEALQDRWNHQPTAILSLGRGCVSRRTLTKVTRRRVGEDAAEQWRLTIGRSTRLLNAGPTADRHERPRRKRSGNFTQTVCSPLPQRGEARRIYDLRLKCHTV